MAACTPQKKAACTPQKRQPLLNGKQSFIFYYMWFESLEDFTMNNGQSSSVLLYGNRFQVFIFLLPKKEVLNLLKRYIIQRPQQVFPYNYYECATIADT